MNPHRPSSANPPGYGEVQDLGHLTEGDGRDPRWLTCTLCGIPVRAPGRDHAPCPYTSDSTNDSSIPDAADIEPSSPQQALAVASTMAPVPPDGSLPQPHPHGELRMQPTPQHPAPQDMARSLLGSIFSGEPRTQYHTPQQLTSWDVALSILGQILPRGQAIAQYRPPVPETRFPAPQQPTTRSSSTEPTIPAPVHLGPQFRHTQPAPPPDPYVAPPRPTLPPGWNHYLDAHQRRYYVHELTGASQWELPRGAPNFNASSAAANGPPETTKSTEGAEPKDTDGDKA
ncbi:hypothetical protein NW762_007797 [Fusarium torreyae]|uniref:WW domain-containing protein n=1 Tax=Fusarium torreyae TaxID=1237075 RepID=A0A9W8RYZ7_9HYPO|nr:hypothetical protein NW762_007797 [Fusarium torreyae]